MDADVIQQMKVLETEIAARQLRPARPVGLRYDRLAGEGWLPATVPSAEARPVTSSYWSCNQSVVAALLNDSKDVLIVSEEPWAQTVSLPHSSIVTRSTARDLVPREKVGEPGERTAPGRIRDTARTSVPFDAVLADSSILLSGEVHETLSHFRRALRKGGRVVLLVANWEYEMGGEPVRYELSFRRYHGEVYAGLIKRTLEPAYEVEYVCRLDPGAPVVQEMAKMSRDELRLRGIHDVPGLGRLVAEAEIIRIPQATAGSLAAAGREAGFSRSVVSGAPGILAARADRALPANYSGPAGEVRQALALSFPFVPASGSPHLLAVFLA